MRTLASQTRHPHAIHQARRAEARDGWPLPSRLGIYAATDTPHEFVRLDSTQCLECWGWFDDPRHLVAPAAPAVTG
ncbi:hypothetical protein FJK98_02330 [Micromonospora sp. HM134]|uniref:hypothetical protein n=1 Tax=Micromonospora sp. HM134 TaxID=2583243 RepID=UPI001198862C|nr:hypothetical protein [Micromonospora sp. HM134]QDY06142.1 hypothetical protein FJK98_02330 [Micromonospora sp. HM134]